MAQALRTSLQAGGLTQGGLRPGLGGDNIFASSALDLNFGMTKSLGGLVTFTRASSGTYVGSDGVLKTATTNLLLRSEELDNASWLLGTGTVTANTQPAPTGAATADTFTTTSGTPILYQDVTCTASTVYTFSFYVRLGTMPASDFRFAVRDNTGAAFIATDIVPSVTPVTTEWRRVSYTFTTPVGCVQVRPYLYRFTFVTGGTVHLWGAQLEQSSTVGEYIPTTSTINSAPRFDHNPTTGESLGLLVEEQRTNSIRNNTMVGAVAGTPGTLPTNWTTAATTGIAINVVSTGTENGITYIDVQFVGTSTAASQTSLRFEGTATMSALASTAYTGSCHIRTVAGSLTNISSVVQQLVARNSGGTNIGENIVDITSSLSVPSISRNRPTNTYTTPALTTAIQHDIRLGYNSGVAIDITLRIGLPQLEQGAFATSVIPTTTATATRSADVASITGTNFSSWYRQDEGTVFADVNSAPVNNIAQLTFDISEGAGNERMFQRRNASGIVATAVLDNGVTQGDIGSVVIGASARYRSGFAYKLNELEIVVNGGGSATDTSATVPTPDRLHIGQNYASGQSCNGTLRRLTFWSQRLPSSTLQAITQ